MLARAARTNKASLLQYLVLLRNIPVIYSVSDGPVSFTLKDILNVHILIDQSFLYIRSLKLNG